MIHERQLPRLAPKTHKASVTAVAGLAKFYDCSPDRLSPEQIRPYLHHLLVARRLAWSSCHQAAAGLQFLLTLLFKAVRQTLVQLGQRNLGGQIGCPMVLHPWEQTLGAQF